MGQGEFSSFKTQVQLYQMLLGGKKASKHVQEKQDSLLRTELITIYIYIYSVKVFYNLR